MDYYHLKRRGETGYPGSMLPLKRFLILALLSTSLLNAAEAPPYAWELTDLLPVDTFEAEEVAGLYPYWGEFFTNSRSFRDHWIRANEVGRSGKQTDWNSITQNALMLAQSYRHLVDRDGWNQWRAPYLSEESWSGLEGFSDQIEADPEMRKLFYLMLYLRDLGWAETGRGQFHQAAAVPIVEAVMGELGYSPELIALSKAWAADHSMPAELYLGEVSPRSLERLNETYGPAGFLPMVALLSALELDSIRYNVSALQEPNSRWIVQLGRGEAAPVDLFSERLLLLAAPAQLYATTPPEVRAEFELARSERLKRIESWITDLSIEDQLRIARLLKEVDFHYVAGTFPEMEPEAVASFLLYSARLALPEVDGPVVYRDVINMNQFLAVELNDRLLQSKEELPVGIDEERQSIVWMSGMGE